MRPVAPGLLLAVAVAGAALGLGALLPPTFSPVLLSVFFGLAVGNLVQLPERFAAGIDVAAKRVLRLGVVLLGAKLFLGDVVAIGARAVWAVLLCMAAAFLFVALGARLTGMSPRLAVLIAVGTAVCGNSAIAASAPVIKARDREISFAIGTITLFGTLALFVFPLLGHLFAVPDAVFGAWAGLSINDTSQVVAAGAAHSETARDTATVVKLIRNALMGPVILGLAWWARGFGGEDADGAAQRGARKAVPLFVLGFLALAALRSVGLIGAATADTMGTAASLCITVAIAAVGLGTRFSRLRSIGLTPFLVGLGAATVIAGMGFALAWWQ